MITEHPQAAREYDEAIAWYEARRPGLGVTLIERVDEAQDRILRWPDASPPFPGWDRLPLARHARVEVYPYRIVYVVRGEGIVILAYAHASRRPDYWHHRYDD